MSGGTVKAKNHRDTECTEKSKEKALTTKVTKSTKVENEILCAPSAFVVLETSSLWSQRLYVVNLQK